MAGPSLRRKTVRRGILKSLRGRSSPSCRGIPGPAGSVRCLLSCSRHSVLCKSRMIGISSSPSLCILGLSLDDRVQKGILWSLVLVGYVCHYTKETERGRKRKEEKEGVILVLHQKKSCKEVYVCMKFSGYSHSGFGDNATFKNGEISPSDRGL